MNAGEEMLVHAASGCGMLLSERLAQSLSSACAAVMAAVAALVPW